MNLRPKKACVLFFPVLLFSCSGAEIPENRSQSEAPKRIVSLVPAVTEMLFALGAGELVVGVSNYDTYPSEVIDLPRVGALLNPDIERIFALQPELVIIYGTQTMLRDRLGTAGIRHYPFLHGPITEILDYMVELGRELHMETEGRRLAEEIRGALAEIRRGAPEKKPRVFLAHSREVGTIGSFYSGGGKSFFNELINIAGGINIFGDIADDSIQPSLEEILARQPEIIIELLPSDKDDPIQIEQRTKDWKILNTLPAVRQRRIHILAGDYLLLIGPRLHLAARRFAEVIRNGRELD